MSQTRMEFAYTQLLDKVLSGSLKPGDRLVNRTLGDELGVSTVTVREAIQRLASDGIVEHVPNAGAYVRKLTEAEMIDLFSFRAWLDLFAVKEAVRRIERHELDRLGTLCGEMRCIIVTLRGLPNRQLNGDLMTRWLDLDRRFHRLLVDAAHNSWLTKATEDIHLLSHVMKSKALTSEFGEAVWTYRQHVEITKALQLRDESRVTKWTRIHGDQALATLLKDLETRATQEFGLANATSEAVV